MDKEKGRIGFLTLVCQLVSEQENFEFKPVELYSKIDLVSHRARTKGLVNESIWLQKKLAIRRNSVKEIVVYVIISKCRSRGRKLFDEK